MITLILTLLTLTLTAPENHRLMIVKTEPLSDAMTWDNIKHEITKCDLKYPDIVLRQIMLETGNLTSRICRECNNLIGMKYPRRRETTAIGRDKSGMSVYDSWQDCIADYKLWQDYAYRDGDYMTFLNRIYATDVYYKSKLKRLLNN